jgi:hypothetical protein
MSNQIPPRGKGGIRLTPLLRRRGGSTRTGEYAPNLWHVSIAAVVAVIVAGLAACLAYLGLQAVVGPLAPPTPLPPGNEAQSGNKLDLIKTTIAVMAFLGAVLTGVYAYRKQRLAEGDAHRSDAKQFVDRYGATGEQLGHEAAAVRLAGAYAMAGLADDWQNNRQMCVDVLCAYIRMPYQTDNTKPNFKEGDREVRRTIMRIIRDGLRREDTDMRWRALLLSFEGATFDYGDLSGAIFEGGYVSFHRAKFIDRSFHFDGGSFSSRGVTFGHSLFDGAEVFFKNVDFSGTKEVRFNDAIFRGGIVHFDRTNFDSVVKFTGAISFPAATVTFQNVNYAVNAQFGVFADYPGLRRGRLPPL